MGGGGGAKWSFVRGQGYSAPSRVDKGHAQQGILGGKGGRGQNIC